MTMIIAKNNGNSIIMTADSRITYGNGRFEDGHKKIRIIDDTYLLAFIGSKNIADNVFEYIDENKDELKNSDDVLSFFKESFIVSRNLFQQKYPGVDAISIFLLGYLHGGSSYLYSFSLEDDYGPVERPSVIKLNAENEELEENLNSEISEYLNSEIKKHGTFYSYQSLADIYFSAIKNIDDPKISKTGNTVILTSNGIGEFEHN